MKAYYIYTKRNPNSSYVGVHGIYRFVNGRYETSNPKIVEELVALGFESKERPDIKVPEKKEDEFVAPKPELRLILPKNWTLAKMYEYADEMKIQIPDDIVLSKDIKFFLEEYAKSILE